MFDLGFAELVVIGITALIVVGPKELPVLFRKVGQFVGKMRGMAREFSRAMDDAAGESGMKDMARDLRGLSNPTSSVYNSLKEASNAAADLTDLDPTSETGKLSAERKAQATKIQAKAARASAERMAKEAEKALAKAEALEAEAAETTAPAPSKSGAPET